MSPFKRPLSSSPVESNYSRGAGSLTGWRDWKGRCRFGPPLKVAQSAVRTWGTRAKVLTQSVPKAAFCFKTLLKNSLNSFSSLSLRGLWIPASRLKLGKAGVREGRKGYCESELAGASFALHVPLALGPEFSPMKRRGMGGPGYFSGSFRSTFQWF